VPKHAVPGPVWHRLAVLIVTTMVLGAFVAVGVRHSKTGGPNRRTEATGTTTTVASAPPIPIEPGSTVVNGQLTFRGNRTHTLYGQGPVPRHPSILWSYPDKPMCSQSHDLAGFAEWCGMGWTGQPAVWERDGRTLIAFGAYDRAVHLIDAADGSDVLPPFVTGDLIKGSVTIDPDGFPLLYTGSRDDYFRVLALDRPALAELWKINAYDVSPTKWNNDWDGSALVVDDYLFEGGENSVFHIIKLNRATNAAGNVTVAPKLVFHAAGWDDQLLEDIGDDHVSIESSVAIFDDVVYFANSGGLIEGWDVTALAEGVTPERVFRFWTGDDTDASVVIDDQGMLYVASEYERGTTRSKTIGQIMKLDPAKPDDPLTWSIQDRDAVPGGVWATPALDRDMLYVATNGGRLLGIDRMTGAIRWTKKLPGPTWQSPVVVDNVLIEGDCSGVLHAYDVSDTTKEPPELWKLPLPKGCIEATPVVWKGVIYLGTRSGKFFAIGDR
jgi:outer membrane protein assembly factor BamB